jgi:ribosomal protein L11 methyltransferase
MGWLQVSVTTDPEVAEAVAEVMRRVNPNGVALDLGQGTPVETVTVCVYLKVDTALEERRRQLEEALGHLDQIQPIPQPIYEIVNDEDWKEAWQDTLTVLHVGGRFAIRPPWRQYTPRKNEIVLSVDPGLAFGTGLHPSTQLCLEALDRRCRPGMHVLDLGTGTGILALAAAKLGADSVLAVDHDAEAVAVARQNARRNHAARQIRFVHGSLVDVTETYDLILANLLSTILIDMARSGLGTRLAPDGIIIAAGILQEQAEEVTAAFDAAGLQILAQPRQEDWVAIVAQRRGGG